MTENNINNLLSELEAKIDNTSQPEKNNTDHKDLTKGTKPSFWTFFLYRPRITGLAILATILLGFTALTNIDIEANPEVSQPVGIVQTFYPNSSPSDVEEQITNPLEKEIANLSNLSDLQSTSTSGLSSITATFDSSVDPDQAILDLREAVNNATGELPEDAEIPQVIKFDFNNQPIVTLSVLGPLDKVALTKVADNIQDEIEAINGVSKAELSGDVEEIIRIELNPGLLEHYNISIGEVINAINSNNLNVPLGEVSENNEEINFRLIGKAETIEELGSLPVRNNSTEESFDQLTLSQLGLVYKTIDKQETDSFVNTTGQTAERAISLSVFKETGGNIVGIVDNIDARIDELNKELSQQNVEIVKTNDNAYFIRNDIRTLSISGLQTIVIIFFSLFIFLTARESFVASLAIPFIFLITIGVLFFTGQTLNGLTIFSLILSLGLIVDTSIVIAEGIHDYRKEGLPVVQAATKAIHVFKGPLIAGTLTTISAFFPMLLVSGIVGDFIKTIPIVLSITLVTSLFVSFSFSPLLATKLLKKVEDDHELSFKDRIINSLRDFYESVLRSVIYSTSTRVIITVVTLVLFFASLALPATGILKPQLFPVVDTPFTFINIEAPQGTELATTRELAKDVEAVLTSYPEIDNYVLNLGRGIDTGFSGGSSGTAGNLGHFIVNFNELSTGREKSYEINDRLREELDNLNTKLEVKVEDISSGPPVAAPLEARIIGPDLDELKNISDKLKNELSQIEGLINISSEFDNIPSEAILNIDQDIANYFGVTNQQTALIVQGLTSGIKTGQITLEGNEHDIKVQVSGATENTAELSDISSLPIVTQQGTVPLGYLGQFEIETALKNIPHLDQERTVRVRAFTEADVQITALLPEIESMITNMDLDSDYKIEIGGEDEDIQESFTELFSSMFIAILLILIILVLIFNSFRQTIIVLMTIPLAVIGIFPGLSLIGLPLSFPAFLGVVMLTGIVVNDAIVLIDQININRKTMAIKEAIIKGARSRLTPIILTSITTIFGLVPITASDEFWRGLGFSVIFGLIAATFLTLFIIPILFSFFFRKS